MTHALHVRDLALRYPRAAAPALAGVSLDVMPGERILVTGPSGSGKSSLALCWSGIIPHAVPAALSGAVDLCGRAVAQARVADLARDIAYVFQDADTQLCALSVEDEIAFALENRCIAAAEIDRRIDAAMAAMGLPRAMRRRETLRLSGGEKQKVVLAAALAQDVPVYVFDEPTSQLDPEATAITYSAIDRLTRGADKRSLIYIDHKVERLLSLTDRVLLLGDGGVPQALETPRTLFHDHVRLVDATGAWLPAAADLYRHLRAAGLSLAARPLTLAEALADLDAVLALDPALRPALAAAVRHWLAAGSTRDCPQAGAPVLTLDRVSFAPSRGAEIVRDVSLILHGGEILGLVGRNGAGKSTLGQLIANLLAPTRGMRRAMGDGSAVGQYLFQNPEHQFVAEVVREELLASVLGGTDSGAAVRADAVPVVDEALKAFGLWAQRDSHPFQLSQGQKRRLSFLAATLAPARPVLVLDEPSYGLDAQAARRMRDTIREQRRPDRAIVVISHDIDWLDGLCDRIAIMEGGRLSHVGPAAEVLANSTQLTEAGLSPPLKYTVAAWLDERC